MNFQTWPGCPCRPMAVSHKTVRVVNSTVAAILDFDRIIYCEKNLEQLNGNGEFYIGFIFSCLVL